MKNILIAMAPMCLLVSSAMAQDDLFSDLASGKTDSISAAQSELQDLSLDGLDVSALTQDAGTQAKADSTTSDEAIEACFRRFGWGGYRSYNSCWYNSCWYNPCYYTYYCYRPCYSYSYCYPTTYCSYWGCY